MKLLNYTTSYFAVILLFIISVWATVFYYDMLDEIYDSIDDGLDNQKGLIIQRAAADTILLRQTAFGEGGYAIRETDRQSGISFRDKYVDTTMYMQNEEDFEPVRLLTTVFQQNGKYYQLQVSTSMVEEDDLVAELFKSLLWLYIGLVATILLLNNFLLKKIWSPFYNLLEQLKTFKLAVATTINVQPTKVDEFRLLNESLQKLLQSNIDAYNNQKQFIENASHELQTPLAISINKLEALAEHSDITEAQMILIVSALENLERLRRLNKSLLLLSKIENKQFDDEENIRVNDLVKKIVSDFDDQLQFSQLTIHIVDEFSLAVNMNADLAAILITNLIKNAIVHNRTGGFVKIITSEHMLSIENSGKEDALQADMLFTRFSKQTPVSSSTGLGLAIAKAITDLYTFRIAYSFNKTHTLTVHFSH